MYGSDSSVDEFRRVVRHTCAAPPSLADAPPTSFLVASYTRAALGQTGTGHFSPVGAYDEASDKVLLLDTARFKYGVHWLSLPLLFNAMLPLVPATGRSRGYLVLSYRGRDGANEGRRDAGSPPHPPVSLLFRSRQGNEAVRGEYRRRLDFLRSGEDAAPGVSLAEVVAFWTDDNAAQRPDHRVWELLEPQLQPVAREEIAAVRALRALLGDRLAADGPAAGVPHALTIGSREVGACCRASAPHQGPRVLDVSPAEALYVIYLASLPPEVRREVVCRGTAGAAEGDGAPQEQLLAEAALVSYAFADP